MLQVLLIGGVVCTALSMSGSLVTQYKIAYWLGATPRRIEIANLLGAVLASAATTAVILLMAKVYGFSPSPAHPTPLPAPQPNAMAAVLRGVMGDAGTPWFLYGVGGVFAVSAEMCGVSGLAFALGMYLPMELNSPLVYGAARLVAAQALVEGREGRPRRARRRARWSRPASSPAARSWASSPLSLRFVEDSTKRTLVPDLTTLPALGSWVADWGNWNGLVLFLLLGASVYWYSRRATA